MSVYPKRPQCIVEVENHHFGEREGVVERRWRRDGARGGWWGC